MVENARDSAIGAPRKARIGVFLVLAALGCSVPVEPEAGAVDASMEPPPIADAGVFDTGPAEGPARLEVGTGEAAFVPFADGGTLDLVPGCQGSQHVWVSLRTTGLVAARAIVTSSLERVRDDVVVGQLLLRLDLEVTSDGAEAVGLTLIVPDPSAALDEDLRLRAHVRDAEGVEVEVVRTVRVAWGPDGCSGHG